MRRLIIATIAMVATVTAKAGQAVAASSTFRSAPATIAFGTKQVGSTHYDGGGSPIRAGARCA